MNRRTKGFALGTLGVALVLAVAFFLPAAVGANGGQPVVPTGICIQGQVIDKAHNGLGGLTVLAELQVQPAQAALSATTDKDGFFKFDNVAPGVHTLRVIVPDSWNAVTPSEFPIEVGYGHDGCYQVRFKLEPLGCILVKKTDGKGRPLADWKITVSGPVDPEMKTGPDGTALFTKLTPGTYVVSEDVPYPWKALTPTKVSVQVRPAKTDNDCSVVEFRNEPQPTTCVTGYKVDDQHQGLPGWKITAKRVDGNAPTFTAVTGPDGSFTIGNLTLGEWTISEELQKWWTPITPASFNVTLKEPGDKCVVVRFKNRAPDLCAEGYKVDEKGVGLAGWKIKAYSEADPAMQMTATTDAHGYYRFVGLTLGNWIFEEEVKTGWKPITPDKVKIAITGGACTKVPIFRNQSPRGCVEGWKRDDQGFGLPGWNVSLKPVGGGTVLHADTDGTGYFRFDNLPLGKYEVWEELQVGWEPTQPTKQVVEVIARDKPVCERVEFENRQVPRDICIDGYKLDTNGKVGLPGFTVTAKHLQSSTVMTATTDGLGYFRFSTLAPGTYEVKVAEQSGWVPVGPSAQTVSVDWPPKLDCKRVIFYDRQKTDPPPPPRPRPLCVKWHVVQKGQTLSGIAGLYGVTVKELMAANRIANPNLVYVGQKLCIPDP